MLFSSEVVPVSGLVLVDAPGLNQFKYKLVEQCDIIETVSCYACRQELLTDKGLPQRRRCSRNAVPVGQTSDYLLGSFNLGCYADLQISICCAAPRSLFTTMRIQQLSNKCLASKFAPGLQAHSTAISLVIMFRKSLEI
ncbi:hypothetical protein J6590_063469 [Homalodisca vitripennis]|nr:hypothetical protein J6590_063469 [Homalodisca vitripennis]